MKVELTQGLTYRRQGRVFERGVATDVDAATGAQLVKGGTFAEVTATTTAATTAATTATTTTAIATEAAKGEADKAVEETVAKAKAEAEAKVKAGAASQDPTKAGAVHV